MLIKDLEARQSNVDVEGEVVELSDVREFDKFGKKGRVATAIITDGSAKIKLSLWNEQIEKVRLSDKVKIQKGYVSEFQGELQLTTGKFGTLDVIRETESAQASEPSSKTSSSSPSSSENVSAEELSDTENVSEKEKAIREDNNMDIEEEDFS